MKTPRTLFVAFLVMIWFTGILFYSFKEAADQERILKTAGMILVQGGCYEMGNPSGDAAENERPVHMVCVDPFYLGKEMVTVGEFKQFVFSTGYRTDGEKSGGCETWNGERHEKIPFKNWRNTGYPQNDQSPVVCVSWNDASEFIQWRERKSPNKGMAYRLPTEGEWEYAARNGGKQVAGNSFPGESKFFHRTANAGEWLFDWYGENFYKEGDKTNPTGPSGGEFRVIRGDFSIKDQDKGSLFSRHKMNPRSANSKVGFRLVLPLTDR